MLRVRATGWPVSRLVFGTLCWYPQRDSNPRCRLEGQAAKVGGADWRAAVVANAVDIPPGSTGEKNRYGHFDPIDLESSLIDIWSPP